jgi:hypothetical protein
MFRTTLKKDKSLTANSSFVALCMSIDFSNGINPDSMLMSTTGIAAASRSIAAAGISTAKGGPKYKKAPDAPKRFKSAFIIFSAEKHKEIKDDLIKQGRTEKVCQMSSYK